MIIAFLSLAYSTQHNTLQLHPGRCDGKYSSFLMAE